LLHYFPRMLIPWDNSLSYWKSKQPQLNKIKNISFHQLAFPDKQISIFGTVWYQRTLLQLSFFSNHNNKKTVAIWDRERERDSNKGNAGKYTVKNKWVKKVRCVCNLR
jgi:hypothetical protein